MKHRLLFVLIAVLFTGITASAQSWLWGEQGSTGKKTDLFARNVATNRTGNVYHTGGFETSVIFAPDTLKAVFEDVFLVKYDQDGNVLWARQSIAGQSAPNGYSVATNDSDNSYVTGYGGNGDVFGPDTLKGSTGGFLVKYDPNGNVIWVKPSGMGYAVATDKFGHEFVTGGGFLTKYDRNGNVIWTETQVGGYSDATDPFGNVYIAGAFADTLKIGTYKLYSANSGVFVAKFDSNGNVLWAQQSTNTPANYQNFAGYGGYSVAADMSGAAYITGAFTNSINFGSNKLTTPGGDEYNFFLVKYNPGGALVWVKDANLNNNNFGGWGTFSICTDDSNHIYISGAEGNGGQDGSFIFGKDTFTVTNVNNDAPSFLIKLDSAGNVICGSTLNGGGEYPNAVASDSTGKFVYMGGGFVGTLYVGKDALTDNSGGYNTFVGRWLTCTNCGIVSTVASEAAAICIGQSVTLTTNSGSSYNWSPAIGLSATTGDTVVASPTITTTYTVTLPSIGCTDSGQVVVTVKPQPVFSVSPPSPSICNGQYVILTANGASSDNTYTWNPSTGLTATTGSSIIAISSTTTTYTVAATLNGCEDSSQIVVNVGSPTVTITPPNASVCTGQSILLIASGATTYVWSPSQSLNSATGDTVVATPSIQTTYTVVGTNPGGCFGSDTDVVSIILGLNTPTITQRGDTLFSSATQGNQWVLNDTVIPGATNVFYVITVPGWYKVLAINPSNGCSTASDSSYVIPTGIAQLSINSNQLSVYPNPTGGEIFISISSSVPNIKDWSLQITDVLGRTLYSRLSLNYSNDIDLSNLSDGVYFITVVNKTGRAVVPVVKQ